MGWFEKMQQLQRPIIGGLTKHTVKTWDVYINGKYTGEVQASDEQGARNAAISVFRPDVNSDVSVMIRSF